MTWYRSPGRWRGREAALARLPLLCAALLAPLACARQPTDNDVEAWWACVQEVERKLEPGAGTHHPPILSDSVSVDYRAGTFVVSSSVTLRRDAGPDRHYAYTCRIRQSPLGVWEPARVTLSGP